MFTHKQCARPLSSRETGGRGILYHDNVIVVVPCDVVVAVVTAVAAVLHLTEEEGREALHFTVYRVNSEQRCHRCIHIAHTGTYYKCVHRVK